MSDIIERLQSLVIGIDGPAFARQGYPPHDVLDNGDGTYAIQIAAAGFAQDELSVAIDQGRLKISGCRRAASLQTGAKFVHKGIASRDFELLFPMVELEVVGAKFADGILRVDLQKVRTSGVADVPINGKFAGSRKVLKEA